jgi:hypothetical protein
LDEAPSARLTYVDVISRIVTRDSSSQLDASLRATFDSSHVLVGSYADHAKHISPTQVELENCQMLVRQYSRPEKQTMISLKTALIMAVLVVFGILHVVGAVLLHDAATPRPIDTSEMLTGRD